MAQLFQRNVSFNRQLSTAFVVGIVILAITSSILVSWVASSAARKHVLEDGYHLTTHFAAQSRLALIYQSDENASLPVKTILSFPDVLQVAIFLADGTLFVSEGSAQKQLGDSWRTGLTDRVQLVHESGDAWYFASKVLSASPEDTAESPFGESKPDIAVLGYVLTAVGKGSLQAMTRRIFMMNSGIAIALASVLLLILRVITRRLTNPLVNLSSLMQQAENGATGIRAKLRGPKDIVDMQLAFNQMMDELETRESELKYARDAALETARVKAEFAAVVSHEIRTPLNGVLGMLNLLQEHGVPERQREFLDVAISSGATLTKLINDILDFSKIEAGKLQLDSIEFNIRECLEDEIVQFAEPAQTKCLDLCLDIPADLPVTVTGDPIRLRQVLNNFLSNGIKFTEKGEVILGVEAGAGAGAEYDGKQWFKFSVQDSGIGISKQAQEKIFDSFHQGDGSITRKYGGTGLGLTICKQLITLLGGELQVDSQPGRGSQFSFSIGLDVVARYQPQSVFVGQNIIIFDRNSNDSRYLAETLTAFGCRCQYAASDQEVLNLLKDNESRVSACIFDPASCIDEVGVFVGRVCSIQPELGLVLLRRIGESFEEHQRIDESLSKPVRYAALKACMQRVLLGQRSAPGVFSDPKDAVSVSDKRILIVDDNRTNQLVAKAMLAQSGYQSDVAVNGEDAVAFVSEKNYALVLMDCSMPVMDGYEATKRIRSLPDPVSKVPIFAMTAIDNPEELERCFEVGMNDCVIKPLTLEILREKLTDLFRGDQPKKSERRRSDMEECIDPASFANLEYAMGDKVSEIIDAFLADSPGYLEQLSDGIEQEDWPMFSNIAHTLKGSARNLGVNQLAALSRELEELAGGQQLSKPRAMELLSELRQEYQRVETAFKRKTRELEKSGDQRAATRGELVLVVDDDRSIRLTIENALEPDGLVIEHAVNGQAAVAKFSRLKPDLIIMDALMPVMDGFEASREINQLPGGRATPILIITAMENDKFVERAFEAGAADFIPKPINLAVLRRRVKRILEASQSEQIVKELAYNDNLTGLPNRIAFSDRLQQDLAHAKRNSAQLAVMFVDVDHFKDVNDNLGHAAGDELLKIMSERFAGCIRSEDTLARLGGDEFVVVLSSIKGPKGADIAAQNILKALSVPFRIMGREIYVGASIGISIYPDDGKDREALLKNADTAMYRAKALGRNNFQFYTLEMSASVSDRVELETDLRKVTQTDQLLLFYQPKMDSVTRKLIGAEALIRWQHPRRGFLLPDSFIPIAEDAGLIDDLGIWVMHSACRQFKRWQDETGFSGSVAVNVSVRQFRAPDFVGNVKNCLELSGLDPKFLELEITENTVLEHADETIDKLTQLSAMGVVIAIDDFGVGYSSFNYLKRMPVKILKIDKSFVHDIPEDQSGAAIIDGMIKLAHNLGLKVVAEGVENYAQYQFLKEHHCDTIQGFLVSKPVRSGEFFDNYITQGAELFPDEISNH